MIELDPNTRLVRWFLWSVELRSEFWGHPSSFPSTYSLLENGTNRCFFLRVTLVWVPLILLLQVVVWGSALASMTWLPYTLFGWQGLAWTWGVPAALWLGGYWFSQWYDNRPPPGPKPEVALPKKSPGVVSMVWDQAWDRVCPRIKFKQPEGPNESP